MATAARAIPAAIPTTSSTTSASRASARSAAGADRAAQNYLLREMGFAVARKHAQKLRRIALILGFAAPLVLTLLAALLGGPVG